MSASYRILVTDDIDRDGIDVLTSETAFQVDTVPTLPSADLLERINNYDALIGRSATRISRELLRRGTRLRVIGRAGVGVDNIALDTATELGVAVSMAPMTSAQMAKQTTNRLARICDSNFMTCLR